MSYREWIDSLSPERLKAFRERERIRARKRHALNMLNPEWRKKKAQYFKERNKTERAMEMRRKNGLDRHHKKYKSDVQFVLRHRLRSRIRGALGTGIAKHGKTQDLIGCTYEQLRKHIESQFTRGMTWDNQGEWHIDHIIPCAAYDLTKPEQQRACFNWQNLRPLWAIDNTRKRDAITHPQQHIPLSYA